MKKPVKSDKKDDSNSVPVTEIPRARPEILPTTPSTEKKEDHNPVWFSDSKVKPGALSPSTTSGHLIPAPTARVQSLGGVTAADSGIPVQGNSNRIPTQAPPLQRAKVWGMAGAQNSIPRSRVQNTLLSNTAMVGQSQNTGAFNRAQYKNLLPMNNAFQKAQTYQSSNTQLVPGYPRPPNPYQWPGNQAWQDNRAGLRNSWGRGYSPPSYSSDQLDIGRRKRDVIDNNKKQRRQSAVWYNSRQYPSQYNYAANRGIIPSTAYQQPRNYFPQNSYQGATNTYQTAYKQPSYGQSLGMGISPAGQQSQSNIAPGLRSQSQTNMGYGTQPGILSGARPAPVERWPTLVNPIQKPTLALHSQNAAKPVLPSTKSRIEFRENQKPNQNSENRQTVTPGGQMKPTEKVTNELPHAHEAPKQSGNPVQRTSGSKKAGPQNNLLKKLQDMSSPATHAKTQLKAHKRQNITIPSIKRNEKHVVPMFGGDILLSVGALQLLQKFTRLSGSKVTETELKV